MIDAANPRWPKLSWQAARAILHAGEVRGKKLTPAQRRFFGALVSAKAPPGLTAKQIRAKAKAWARRTGEPWKGNPGMMKTRDSDDGLTLDQARRLLPKYDLDDIVHATRPRDRDKLLAEVTHQARRSNPDADLRALERAASMGDTQAKKRLAHARRRAGIATYGGKALPAGVVLKKRPRFAELGEYSLGIDVPVGARQFFVIYRDPASRQWFTNDPLGGTPDRSHVSLGSTLFEAIETMRPYAVRQAAARLARRRARRRMRGNPRGAPTKKPLGHQQGGKVVQVSFTEAVERFELDKVPGFAKAMAHYRQFHGADPDSVSVMQYPGEGSKVVVRMGEVPETHYLGPDNSNKRRTHWVHKHSEKGKGKNPDLLFDPETGLMTIAGGTYKVTRWIYH